MDQTFAGPVNSQFTIEHIHGDIFPFAPMNTKLPEKAWVALTLIDRDPQITAISDRIDEILKTRAGGPLLVILRGVRPDLHQNLVLRCGLVHFARHYAQSTGWTYLGRVPWPRGATSIVHILRKLRDAVGLPIELREQGEIEARLASLENSLCFSHYIESVSWDERQRRLITDWIRYMREGWPLPPVGCLVIGFLCFDYTIKQTAFENFIEEVEAEYPIDTHLSVLMTDPLDLIGKGDIEDWVSEVSRYLNEPTFEARMWNAADTLFETSDQRKRFADIYHQLCSMMASSLVPGVKFSRPE
jgi:hypothetical protein